jgi:hypothetical protein
MCKVDMINAKINHGNQFNGHHNVDVVYHREAERPIEESISLPKVIHRNQYDYREKAW